MRWGFLHETWGLMEVGSLCLFTRYVSVRGLHGQVQPSDLWQVPDRGLLLSRLPAARFEARPPHRVPTDGREVWGGKLEGGVGI